jgi:hypothetical protein
MLYLDSDDPTGAVHIYKCCFDAVALIEGLFYHIPDGKSGDLFSVSCQCRQHTFTWDPIHSNQFGQRLLFSGLRMLYVISKYVDLM